MALKFLVEDLMDDIDLLVEEKNRQEDPKYYITGRYMMAEEKNQNGRIYKLQEMQKEVDRYSSTMIQNRRSIGEMNHPQSTEINPVNACHLVVELKQNGNYFMGKSLVLDTPMGQLLKSLLKDKIQLGISTRGLGSLAESKKGNVVSDFHLIGLDVVHQPSVSDAMLDSILESKEWIVGPDGRIIEFREQLKQKVSSLPKKEIDSFLREQLNSFIQKLRML
jgi:hypothetical protein